MADTMNWLNEPLTADTITALKTLLSIIDDVNIKRTIPSNLGDIVVFLSSKIYNKNIVTKLESIIIAEIVDPCCAGNVYRVLELDKRHEIISFLNWANNIPVPIQQ